MRKTTDKPTLIACIGRTGSGKSAFIRSITSKFPAEQETTFLASRIEEITVLLDDGRRITLIDTPGFDDANAHVGGTLQLLADHLELAHKNRHKLAGILFFHRITTPSHALTPMSYTTLRMLGALAAHNNVTMCTTMWDRAKREKAERREAELGTAFWRAVLDRGGALQRHDNTPASALAVVRSALAHPSRRTRHESLTPTLVEHMSDLPKSKVHKVHFVDDPPAPLTLASIKDTADPKLRKELAALLDGLCGEIVKLKRAHADQERALAERDAEILTLKRARSPSSSESDTETLKPDPPSTADMKRVELGV